MVDVSAQLNNLRESAEADLKKVTDANSLENWRVNYLGRKAELVEILKGLKDLSGDEKIRVGKEGNVIKKQLETWLEEKTAEIKSGKGIFIDATYPGIHPTTGHINPVTQVAWDIADAFSRIGFVVADGPEVELEKYNFDLLNIPANHPARDQWDTFWTTEPGVLLRTHTSPVQVRYLENHKPPVRIISPGRVYRYEAEDASHSSVFQQIEGLVVEKGITLAHLKASVDLLVEVALGGKHETRLRPSFFPFTEPSFEVDVRWGNKWMELLGCGMVHPNVLRAMNIDPKKYSGFAFGTGLERLAMARYGISDIREFSGIKPYFFKQF